MTPVRWCPLLNDSCEWVYPVNRDLTGIFQKRGMKKCQNIQKKMLKNAVFKQKT